MLRRLQGLASAPGNSKPFASLRQDLCSAGRAVAGLSQLCAQLYVKPTQHSVARPPTQSRSYATGILHASIASAQGNIAETGSSDREVSKISIPDGITNVEFSALLLRDMCDCPACVHPSTRQKLYSTADIPRQIRPRSVEMRDDSSHVRITWDNDAPGFDQTHVTELKSETLQQLTRNGVASGRFQERLEPQLLWTKDDMRAPDIVYEKVLKEDRKVLQLVDQLRAHGLSFVVDIPGGKENALIDIATRIGPMKDTFYGLTWDVRTVPAAINAAYTSQDLGFHTDLLYFQNPPHIQLLHCIQSSSSGGSSVFTDAFRSAVDLFHMDENAFDLLARTPVNYHYNHPNSDLYHTTKRVLELRPLELDGLTYNTVREYLTALQEKHGNATVDADATIADLLQKVNWGPPFLAPFSLHTQSGQPVPSGKQKPLQELSNKIDAWHAAARKFSALLHRPEALYERLMQPGECVLFDNTRVLHARKAFDAADVGKARWLKGGYIDKDPYLSKLRVLRGKLGSA